jgi:hypothetical protein
LARALRPYGCAVWITLGVALSVPYRITPGLVIFPAALICFVLAASRAGAPTNPSNASRV